MKTALLLVDIQNDYFPGGALELAHMEASAANAAELLRACRRLAWPIFHVQHLARRPGATFFLPGTSGAEIHPAVKPLPGETVLTKNYPNSFRETGLAELLCGAGIDDLVIAGAMLLMAFKKSKRTHLD